MRILLVYPSADTEYRIQLVKVISGEPIVLEYVAAGVSDHDVRIHDMRFENGYDGLRQVLASFKPDIVGTTGVTCDAEEAIRILQYVKGFDSRILTVVGGLHATVAPDDYYHRDIDVVVIGEGVFAFKELVDHYERGEDFSAIRGIALPDGDRLIRTPARPISELDDLPFPDRSLTSHIRHKYGYVFWGKHLALLRSTQGCPYTCDFCICWQLTGGRYLKRGVESVVQELKTLQEQYIQLVDDEVFIDPHRAMSLAQRIKEEGIHKNYLAFARSDSICSHPELVKAWKEIGLTEVFIGVEGTTDEELHDRGKSTQVEVNNRAIAILQDHDIGIVSSLMVRPDWGKADFERLLNYVLKTKIVSPQYNIMTPMPGTVLYKEVKDQIVYHANRLYDYLHAVVPTKLDLDEFYMEYQDLHRYSFNEPAPLEYNLGKLSHLSDEERNETLNDLLKLFHALGTSINDHQISAERVSELV